MEQNDIRFPIFIDLREKRAVVVGFGAIACRRAQVLRAFGAEVEMIAPARRGEAPGCRWVERSYRTGDLAGAVLAVAATDDRAINRQVGEDARALGIPVSVADCREECTFLFPAVCLGRGLTAGVVSTDNDHKRTARAAAAIRETLEELP